MDVYKDTKGSLSLQWNFPSLVSQSDSHRFSSLFKDFFPHCSQVLNAARLNLKITLGKLCKTVAPAYCDTFKYWLRSPGTVSLLYISLQTIPCRFVSEIDSDSDVLDEYCQMKGT